MRGSMDLEGFSAEEYQDVRQCLETLLSVREGSQPLDRRFGIDYDGIVGYPLNVARNMLSLEIIEKVGIYEPRAAVDSIKFCENPDGMLCPHIHFIKAKEE